ncbi:MAG: ABC transporter ATP-binding protein [Deltaproteobacteria bacterium]|nr:ABC transporter ATP-binding protein [Deltaproteobacteria bacterium]
MPPKVIFENVKKCFKGRGPGEEVVAVEGIDFQIREGEFFCLLGPSGCGKTTVLNLLAGFLPPSAGRITLDGELITAPGADRGVIFQGEDSLFPWLTAEENVAFGLKLRRLEKAERRRIAAEFLNLVGLKGQDHKYPRELSGGMKQRVQIARVLANNPQMLLMDEPFAALDAQTRRNMQDELVRIWSATRKTVLFITHDIVESILLADRIGLLCAGPASCIREVIPVEIPRPRDRTAAKFLEYYRVLNSLMEEEVNKYLARTEENR